MENFRIAVGEYEISNWGNCRRNGRFIKGFVQTNGYRQLKASIEGKVSRFLFHVLVAKCFIGERPEGLDIDHIDRNRLNNTVENLRYVSRSENMRNTSRYRADITEEDPVLRKRIIDRERRIRTGRSKGGVYRPKGAGCIHKRKDGRGYQAVIRINKVRYTKVFKTEQEAETFLIDMKNTHSSVSTPK
jgi:hypothetical protein